MEEKVGVLNYFFIEMGGGGGLRIFPNKRIVSRYIL